MDSHAWQLERLPWLMQLQGWCRSAMPRRRVPGRQACQRLHACTLWTSADKTKGFYDLYGEDALKDGLPDNDGGKQ